MSRQLENFFIGVATFVGIGTMVLVLALLLTWPLMWAINYTFAPATLLALFGVTQISFWKTYCLSVICSWLFKSTNTSKN